MGDIQWILFPQSLSPPEVVLDAVAAFDANVSAIDSDGQDDLKSDDVLAIVRPALVSSGFVVESGKRQDDKISVPVLFGRQGSVQKSFDADALHREGRLVLEVEAGRAVANNQFLKDLFQACMMQDIDYVGIAVRRTYRKGGSPSKDFERVATWFETLYASQRLTLPLKGVLVIGY